MSKTIVITCQKIRFGQVFFLYYIGKLPPKHNKCLLKLYELLGIHQDYFMDELNNNLLIIKYLTHNEE